VEVFRHILASSIAMEQLARGMLMSMGRASRTSKNSITLHLKC
jgi:hypothetical protein